jgi:hypothetical protein
VAETKEKPLSTSQIRMLTLVRDGEDYALYAEGMSGHAGAQTTLQSLVRRELLAWTDEDDLVITAHGRATLHDIEKT